MASEGEKEDELPLRTKEAEVARKAEADRVMKEKLENLKTLQKSRALNTDFASRFSSTPLDGAEENASKKRSHDNLSEEDGNRQPVIVFGESTRLVKKPRLNTDMPSAAVEQETQAPTSQVQEVEGDNGQLNVPAEGNTSKKRSFDDLSGENGKDQPTVAFGENPPLAKKLRFNPNLPNKPPVAEYRKPEHHTKLPVHHFKLPNKPDKPVFEAPVHDGNLPKRPAPMPWEKESPASKWEYKKFYSKGKDVILPFEKLPYIRTARYSGHKHTRSLIIDGITYERGHEDGLYRNGWVRLMNPGQMELHGGVYYVSLRVAFVRRRYDESSRTYRGFDYIGNVESMARYGDLFIGRKRGFEIHNFDYLEYDLMVPQLL